MRGQCKFELVGLKFVPVYMTISQFTELLSPKFLIHNNIMNFVLRNRFTLASVVCAAS